MYKSIDTECVQSGYAPANGEPRVLPIIQSTTFAYDTPEEMGALFDLKKEGFFYTRISNPTSDGLEKKLTALEGGSGAMTTASGMSATALAIFNLAAAGDNFISVSTIYGGTYNLFNITLRRLGIDCRFVSNDTPAEQIEKLVDDRTRAIFIETIANPAGVIADFGKFAAIAEKYGIVLICDNTIATPVLCRPFEWGANVVVHSSTKYLDGHATSVGGIIVDGGNFEYKGNPRYPLFNAPDESYHGLVFADAGKSAFILRVRTVINRDFGAVMSPMNAFLTNLGCETLHLRMQRHSENALKLAIAMKKHPAVEWVKYASLEGDADYGRANKYLKDGLAAGMVSFGIKGGREAAAKFQKELRLFRIVTHIADARSCVLHPASTTHRQLSDADLAAAGVPVNLIRLSVGLEGIEDVLQDVIGALDASQK